MQLTWKRPTGRVAWNRTRALAVGGLAAGAAAFFVALLSAVGAHDTTLGAAKAADATISTANVGFGAARVRVLALPTGVCYTVLETGDTAHFCPQSVGPTEISFVLTAHGVGGIAGGQVRAVIVRLSHKGTVWATLRQDAFYAAVPKGYSARRVVKVLADGTRKVFSA
jgi:hypothetical protein